MSIELQAGDKIRTKINQAIFEFVRYDRTSELAAVVLKMIGGSHEFSVMATDVWRVEDVFLVGDEVEWVKNEGLDQGLGDCRGIVVGRKNEVYYVLPVDHILRWHGNHFPNDRGSWLTSAGAIRLIHKATDIPQEGDEYEVIVEDRSSLIFNDNRLRLGQKLTCLNFRENRKNQFHLNGPHGSFVCNQAEVLRRFLRVKRAGDIVIGSDTGRARVGASAAVVNHQTSGAHKPAEQYSTPTKFKAGDKVRDNTGDIGTVIRWEKNSCGNLAWLVEWADKCTSHEFERRIEFASDMPTTLRPDYFEGRNSEGRTYSDQRMLDERLERECNAEREAERRGKIKKGERSLHRFRKSTLRGMVEIANAKDNYNNSHEIESVENIKLYCAEHGIDFEKSISKPGAS